MKWYHIITKYVANRRYKLILKELKALEEKIPKKKIKILDVGCGNRYITDKIKAKGYNIIGIDKVDPQKTAWMKGYPKPDMIMDAMHMTFKSNTFDVVISLEVIEHAPCTPEIKRVLKKGGLFICSTPAPGTDWVRNIAVKMKLLENQDFEGHDHIVDLYKVKMKIIKYKKMFLGTSQFGVLTK